MTVQSQTINQDTQLEMGGGATASYDNEHSDVNASTSTILSAELSSINSQLLTHGWARRPLNLEALSQKDYNEVVGVLFDLIGASVSNLNTLDTLAARHRTLQYEYERLQKANTNFRSTTAKLESDVAGWKARCTEVERRLHLEEARTKELREDVGRGRKALDGVRVAAGHENKKIQMKLDKSLSQLAKMSSDATVMTRPHGLVLLNPIPAGRIQPVAATQSPLLEQTLRDLSDIRESLQEETEAFRHVVVSTGNGLREALAAAAGQETPARFMHSQFFSNVTGSARQITSSQMNTFQSASSTSHPSLANARLQSLIADVRAKLTEGVQTVVPGGMDGIPQPSPEQVEEQKKVEREQEKKQRDLEDRVKDLEVEVICAQAREDEAKKLVKEMSRLQMEQRMSRMTEIEDGLDEAELQDSLAKQNKAVEEERRKLAEASVRLINEQRQLEDERQAFLEEKRKAEVDAVLALLPPSPANADVISSTEPNYEHALIDAGPSNLAWHKHQSHSPSPLSPLHPKVRTPKHHTAGGRRKSTKTPLSRLVLEKAVRQKSKEGANALEMERLGSGNVLGAEGGRRTNVASPTKRGKERGDGLKSSSLGKSRSSGGSSSSTSSRGAAPVAEGHLKASTISSGAGLRSSTSSAMNVSQRRVDGSKAGGMGPKGTAKGARVWR